MLIKGLQKTTLLDYPGKIACTIFIAGCNFRCPFCQNRDLIIPELAKKLKTYSNKEIFEFLEKRKGKLEAVVITGGEPTLYPELSSFITKCKKMSYLVKLDTNGTNPAMVEDLINKRLIDYVAVDYKGPIKKYENYIFQNQKLNIKNQNDILKIKNDFKKTIKILIKSGIDFELRTTVVPLLHKKEDLIEMAEELKSLIHNSKFIIQPFWFLQQFRPKNCLDPDFDKVKPYDKEWFKGVLDEIKIFLPNIKLRGN